MQIFLDQNIFYPSEDFRAFPTTLGQQQQQSLKLLHYNNYHNNSNNSREYLNFIHHSYRLHYHHHRGSQQQQLRRGSLEFNALKLPTPPPPPISAGTNSQGGKVGSVCVRASQSPQDYCTLRHGKQQRAVQFADQQLDGQDSDVSIQFVTKIVEILKYAK